jgi:hypothetical protein
LPPAKRARRVERPFNTSEPDAVSGAGGRRTVRPAKRAMGSSDD